MNPYKVDRANVTRLEDLPNIGQAMAADLRLIGIQTPEQLVGRDALDLYDALCMETGMRHDPCVIDVFMSVTSFMNGGPALPWWSFTAERKRLFQP
ncbi:MAG: helix-hairpin-helix domain-containing protein [Methylocystis sp.]|uniref:helix-hairpin-helix domain-containing protein n=1 Tax=Methylocystis sp. TaxID=1911079 RepID=UPI003DA5C64C